MDNKRTRLRSQAAVRKVAPTVLAPTNKDTLQRRGAIVEVEVEGEHDRGLPVVRGVNKRKRDPRGGGRRLQQKLESQEGNVSVFVHENADNASADEFKRSERYESHRSPREPVLPTPAAAVVPPPVNTYVIIPEIMPEDQAVMKQLDKRRESSRLRVRPSKFREGFLLSSIKPKGEQKGADDGTSLEIVLPMEAHNTTPRVRSADNNPNASSSRASESDMESSLDRPSQTSSGKNKFKITYKLGSARATERQGSAGDSSLSAKKGFDDHGLKAALAVLKRVMQIKSAEPFNEPVDPVALEIPDYLDVIKEPMDLGTIRELLESGKKYKTVQDVYADVQLIWSNCRSYNQEGDPIMDIMKIAENCFNKHWNAAGLQVFGSGTKVPKAQKTEESNKIESSDEQGAAPEQRGREEAKRRKSKEAKVAAKLNIQKIVHFDTPNSRLKTKRSASVEQVMAESKAREDKLDGDIPEISEDESNFAKGQTVVEVVREEQTLQQAVVERLQAPEEVQDTQAAAQVVEHEAEAVKDREERQANGEAVAEQEAKTPLQDKDNSVRGSNSNKRRTFGTVHHKPDCSCVVCVGRRRKLARQEREGIEEKKEKKEKKEKAKANSPLVLESPEVIKTPVLKVIKPPKAPQIPEAVMESTPLSAETVAVEPDQPDCQMGNASEGEAMVEGVRHYPANYELPLRKVNPSLLQLSRVLFGNHHNTVWRRHHSLGYQLPPSLSKSSMFEAVHSLTLSEK